MVPPSRLALFSEKFIQGGWLVALIVAPLFFNIYSSRVFEPDKIALIRTLALAMGAMWLILRAERWRGRAPRQSAQPPLLRLREWVQHASTENPLTLPALLLLVAYILSTLLSVSPTVSFFGSYQRLQGLYTLLSYLVIFFLAASQLKTRADVERAITIALVASFPIAFYGIVQHYFVDPLPWVGDVTSRVASNLGNSIFIGAFLILVMPLALARIIQTGSRAGTTLSSRGRLYLYAAVALTFLVVAAAWGLMFDVGAKPIIETNYRGTLTPEQLTLSSSAFNLALGLTLLIVVLWWGAALLLKQHAANFLLIALYSTLLAVQLVALIFSQSRGPLLGLLGGAFTFTVLWALARGARKLALGAVGLAALALVVLALLNIPNSPLAALRDLPYVGRMGRVFELEGGTGRVRVLIWQGALKLVVPHEPLWSPLTGDDPLNVIRPLVGYGPETMYVSYNKFYPPELGTLESRNATPDRSHNETFDALVTTGLLGFAAENILFLVTFYFVLKWLGLMPSTRARNLFVTLWFGGGILLAIIFGLVFGWEFIGVALPGGMILGMFTYLVLYALGLRPLGLQPADAAPLKFSLTSLWLIALAALFVAHFIEIHFGIAIVTTRLYFWFFAAAAIVLGRQRVAMEEAVEVEPAIVLHEPKPQKTSTPPPRRKRATPPAAASARKDPARKAGGTLVSTAPLIALAFLVGFMLAVMGYDYINTNNVGVLGAGGFSGLDIVISALTVKGTTEGGMTSFALFWLFLTTLLLGLGISAAEWGRAFQLARRDWGVAVLLFVLLSFAIFSALVFYHVLLIAVQGAAILDALLTAVAIFTAFMLLVATIVAFALLFDEQLPETWVSRTTNYVVMPVLLIVAFVLILATNVEPVRADMLYKQAASFTGADNTESIKLFQRALGMQPQQDYYNLFLGRAYLDAAKATTDPAQQAEYLDLAEKELKRARDINPYNTDHSANLARLAQARGALAQDPSAKVEAYQQAAVYFDAANRLSPGTAHLYDQHAQALLEYAGVLDEYRSGEGADAVRETARQQIQHAMDVDATFCLTHAVRAQAQTNWRDRVVDSLNAIKYAPRCGDVFFSEGLSIAVGELSRASEQALDADEGAEFERILSEAVQTNPSLEVYTTLANFYSRSGRIAEAMNAIDGALVQLENGDPTTRKRYEDFRFTLVQLQGALAAANAAPNDPELQRAVARQWLQRGQLDFALPAFEKVLAIAPQDYDAHRSTLLLLIATDRLNETEPHLEFLQAHVLPGEQVDWNKLGTLLGSIQSGDTNQAVTLFEQLAAGADTQDFALVSALRKLAEKFKGAG